jgi:hypothetical protein
MMKSLASLILLATLTTMSGIRFAQGRVVIDKIAKEHGCGRTMEELQLQQRQMSGKVVQKVRYTDVLLKEPSGLQLFLLVR